MIRLFVIDDHHMMRRLLVEELNAAEDMKVVGEAGSAEEALGVIRRLRVDVVMMDVSLPGMDGVDAALELHKLQFDAKVVCLTMHQDAETMRRAMDSGVAGYALKHDSFADLEFAIRKVAEGERYVSPRLTAVLLAQSDASATASQKEHPVLVGLSARERDVIRLIASGSTTHEISEALCISSRTVDAHRRNILKKTGLGRIADITRFAVRVGLIDTF